MTAVPPPPPEESGPPHPPPPVPDISAQDSLATANWTAVGTGENVELASPGSRLGATLIDTAILIVPIVVLSLLTVVGGLLLGAAYDIVFIAIKGQTPGKMMTGVKVVRADNGMVPGWGVSIIRWIIQFIAYLMLFLPGLLTHASLLWDDRRQGWHDKAASTLVVKA